MSDYDVVVVGAGHNALVCAGYLAKAGYTVCVLERRHKIGGAVVTEEIVPGFQFDLGGSAHILINSTPIVKDLGLKEHGLEYLDLDPLFFAPFPDGSHFTVWRDVDQTCESIATFSQEDAENYRQFVAEWQAPARQMVESFLHAPTPLNMARYLTYGMFEPSETMEKLAFLLRNYGHVLKQTFVSPQVQSLIGWMAAQSGPPPTEPLSGPFALWHPMYHESGMRRPRGGSGMLTQALGRMIEAHGGVIVTDATVNQILVSGNKVVGVELTSGGRLYADKVVSGAHIHTTMQLLGDGAPAKARRMIANTRVGNGFGMVLRCAVDELPNYTALPTRNHAGDPHHTAMQFICPSLDYLEAAYGDFLGKRPSAHPALISMTWSAVDKSLAPAGKHVMFLWAQYFPYELANGQSWDEIGEDVAQNIIEHMAEYAPNVRDIIIDKLVEHPLYLERELGLWRGNVMHLEMSLDQMFAFRPALTMSQYRGPVDGLYLTGASTHPGGGIMGAAGMNAAGAVLHDLSRRRIFKS